MTKQKTTRDSKQKPRGGQPGDITDQLEQAFMAGLGALANAQKAGSKAFDSLVEQGKSFRKGTTNKTETLIDEVRAAIRSMAGEAQSKATGLLDQMRETPQMDKLQSAFDARVADALDRLGVATKHDIDALNAKFDKALKTATKPKRTTRKAAKKKAKKTAGKTPRTSAKKAGKKTTSKKSASKRTTKKAKTKKVTTKRG
ncbi:MAG: phasin family protein [Gammaproteobacteria bacterium]|nr:phasin family protein [Gammaproteobacteria bacterium]